MFNYNYHSRPIHSTLKFWEKLHDNLGDINITYVNVPNENSLIEVLTQSNKPDLYLFDFSGEAIYDEDLLLNKFSYLIDRPFVSLSCDPKLLIADEPTTALDVTVQAEILDLLRNLNQKFHNPFL